VQSNTGNDQLKGKTSNRHRRPRPGRHAQRSKISPLLGSLVAGIAVAGIGVAFWDVDSPANALPDGRPAAAIVGSPVLAGDADRVAITGKEASRSHSRTTAPPGSAPRDSASPAQTPPAQEPPMPTSPTKPAPVAGLSQAQMNNAIAVVEAGRQMNLPRRAFVVAIATALQESNLRVLANPAVPKSMSLPKEGVGQDHDSIGLFQQRPSWGSADQLMDPQESARRFYASLVKIPGWEQMSVTTAAQAVQRSAFPGAYAKHQSRAEQIVDAISP
jgi:hypothetical protein